VDKPSTAAFTSATCEVCVEFDVALFGEKVKSTTVLPARTFAILILLGEMLNNNARFAINVFEKNVDNSISILIVTAAI
jgi:hypothetical protein